MADPLSSLFYPPSWICWFLPLPFSLNLVTIGHIGFGAVGMYYFLRSENMQEFASLSGALIFELMPKIYGHFGSGHITLIWAVAWTPWILLSINQSQQNAKNRYKNFATGGLMAIVILADIRWAFYSLLFSIFFSLYKMKTRVISNLRDWAWWVIKQVSVGILLAAPLLIPFIQYTQLTTRSQLLPEENMIYSLPPLALFQLIFPDFSSFSEMIFYPGVIGILFFIFCLWTKENRKRNLFWILTIMFTIFWAMGSNIPYLYLISKVPIFNLMRVPTRVLFLTGLSFAYLTGFGIMELSTRMDELKNKYHQFPIFLFVMGLMTILFTIGMIIITGSMSLEFIWGTLFVWLFSVVIIYRIKIGKYIKVWVTIFILLLTIDLGVVSLTQIKFEDSKNILFDQRNIIRLLSTNKDIFRVYTPSNTIQQEVGAINGIEFVNGINPLQLQKYTEFMKNATGVYTKEYSVTLPAFNHGNPKSDNIGAITNPNLLGLINTRYIISSYKINGDSYSLVMRDGDSYVYENNKYLPRAWIQDPTQPIGNKIISIPSITITPNKITINTQTAGLLVLSEINYPGWKAWLDGKETEIISVAGILRGIEIPNGEHHIEMIFQPMSLYVGLLISILTILLIISLPRFLVYSK